MYKYKNLREPPQLIEYFVLNLNRNRILFFTTSHLKYTYGKP